MPLIKRLSRHGNSLALVIDRPLLELLEIGPETPLALTTDGKSFYITKADRATIVKAAARKSIRKYEKMYRRLADR